MNTSLRSLYADVIGEANALIEQAQRDAKRWDASPWRSDMREVDRHCWNTIAATRRARVRYAMECCKLIHTIRSA